MKDFFSFSVKGIELMDDFIRLFDHRSLVFSDRNQIRIECRDICSLADRVAEESGRDGITEILLGKFRLDGRIPLQTGKSDQIEIVAGKFRKFRDLGLDEDGGLVRIK